jgi:amyloid beta precursor protein binding protein 1
MQSSIGKKRASEQVPLLTELNESVKGHALLQDVQTFLASSDTPLAPYTMVISVDAPTKDTLQLADACWQQNIPMITVRSSGFIGSIRTQTQEMPFVETHPDTLVDLRLDAPWPELDQYAKSLDTEAMDSADHGHLPAVVIVLRALDAYRAKVSAFAFVARHGLDSTCRTTEPFPKTPRSAPPSKASSPR